MVKTYGSHSVFNINYHIVFCPKRRKACLVQDIADDLDKIIIECCDDLGISIIEKEIMPDHVNLLISSNPKLSPNTIVRSIKSKSARVLREKYPQLLKIPSLWSSSFYCGSVGEMSSKTVIQYIKNQKGK